MSSLASPALLRTLRDLAEPIAERAGCVVVAVELLGGAGAATLRVSVDRPGGVSIDDCTRVSRALSAALDEADPIPSAYTLEVGSPGMQRPVQRPEDFARFIGCEIRVKRYGVETRRAARGRLAGLVDGRVRILTDAGPQEVPLDDVERAWITLDDAQFARMGQGLPPIAGGE